MDSGPPQSAEFAATALSAGAAVSGAAEVQGESVDLSGAGTFSALPAALVHELAGQAEAARAGLGESEFGEVLLAAGMKSNFGAPPGALPDEGQRISFLRALHVRELALAHGCARGKDAAWERFVAEYRGPLREAAVGITHAASEGQELADSVFSELFGMTEREGRRWSPLATYSGRGSLMGWLRATLAQRQVDRHRRMRRETTLEGDEIPAAVSDPGPEPQTLARLNAALAATLRRLSAEDRFLLSAYFLDGRTLLDLARLLQVHEATISRRIRRLTEEVHRRLLQQLEAEGMSRRAAVEALGTDPRDLTVNLRNLLQTSHTPPFHQQTGQERS